MKRLNLIFCVFVCSFLNSQTINEISVKKHLYTLANDSMQGRKAGSLGIEKAAKYIEQQFFEIGLKPFNNSSFRQTFKHINSRSEKEEELKAGESVGVFFPNQAANESGSHINVSGIGLTKNAPNKKNAIKLMEFLTSDSAQKTYVNTSYEYPANPNVEPNEIVKKWGSFKKDKLDLNQLGVYRSKAIEIFDKSDWK